MNSTSLNSFNGTVLNEIDYSNNKFELLCPENFAPNKKNNNFEYETFKEMTMLTILSMEHTNIIDIAPYSFSKMDILQIWI